MTPKKEKKHIQDETNNSNDIPISQDIDMANCDTNTYNFQGSNMSVSHRLESFSLLYE